MRRHLPIALAASWVLASAHVDAGSVTGVVRTIARNGVTPAVAVVYAEPLDTAAARGPRRVGLGQKRKTFIPRVMTVPAGSTIDFPNEDLFFHNVFSLSGPQPFDLGLYRAGETRSRTFNEAGVYRVFCNIHPQMAALIVVAPSAFTTVAGVDGRFTLDLPQGRYRLTVLSERAAPISVEITSTQGASTAPQITLDESSWAFAQHRNKFGAEYPAAAYSR